MSSGEPSSKKLKISRDCGNKKASQELNNVIEDIKLCQVELEKLSNGASEEILRVEQDFNKLRKPFFEQRNEQFKKLKRFWSTAMCYHPLLSQIIQPEEKECLHYINDCIAAEFEDIQLGYKISFSFEPNPYFENKVLTKILHLASDGKPWSETSKIEWKAGKDLVKKYSGLISTKRALRPEWPVTFFDWLLDNKEAVDDSVGEAVKEDLWPQALSYYLNATDRTIDDTDSEGSESSESSVEDPCEASDPEVSDIPEDEKVDKIAEEELEGAFNDSEPHEEDASEEDSKNQL